MRRALGLRSCWQGSGGVSAVALVLFLAGGCGQGSTTEGPIPTVPEQVRADVPTLAEGSGTASPPATVPLTPDTPIGPTEDEPVGAPDDPSTEGGFPAQVGPQVPDDVPEQLAPLYVVTQLLGQDPDQAGRRGEDLQRELERVLDDPSTRRIDRALERIEGWVDKDELDPDVAAAAVDALETARVAADAEGDDDDEDKDED